MKKTLIFLSLILFLTSLYAGGMYATGASLTYDSASKTSQIGLFLDSDKLIVKSEDEKWINPLISNHFDIVFSELFGKDGLDQIGFSYIGGAGA